MPVLKLSGLGLALRMGAALSVLLALVAPLKAKAEISKEYQVKAVFLFNFAQFVQWPPRAFTSPDEPFCIGILGNDPFDGFLDDTVKGETVEGHPLVIRRFSSAAEAKGCQILFVSSSEGLQMAAILEDLKGLNILTVGDSEGFIKSGGIVRFVTVDNKIHFRINPEAAKRAKLVISSKVLRLAQISEPGED